MCVDKIVYSNKQVQSIFSSTWWKHCKYYPKQTCKIVKIFWIKSKNNTLKTVMKMIIIFLIWYIEKNKITLYE